MIYLLDTNVCIAAMRGNDTVRQNLLRRIPGDCGLSVISLYELHSAVAKCRLPQAEAAKVALFVAPLHLLPFDEDAAVRSAMVRHDLEKRGERIGPYDLLLAGQALSLDVTLVTHNIGEFRRVPGLKLEDWQNPSSLRSDPPQG